MDSELLRRTAAATAARHRPKGFSAETAQAADGTFLVTVRYCWRDSPRFQVEAEVYLAAEEVADALRTLAPLTISRIDYLDDHICQFRVEYRV